MMTDEGAATSNGSFVGNFEKVTAPSGRAWSSSSRSHRPRWPRSMCRSYPARLGEGRGDFSKFNNDKDFPVVGNGPSHPADYKVDSFVKLKANKDFWRGSPKFDELVFRSTRTRTRPSPPCARARCAFVAGEPSLTPAQSASLESAPDIKVNDAPGRRFFALAVNPGARTKDGKKFGDGHPALLDQKVRHALFMAVDRKTIIDKVFQGHAVEGEGYIRRASPTTSGSRRTVRSSPTTP
ncbi:ABC transporter substrate-binding protein OS=Streptomyces microflavus OX=1919 GN=Smic_61840 PE=3 SV=1 [Streptomyces microflavus]